MSRPRRDEPLADPRAQVPGRLRFGIGQWMLFVVAAAFVLAAFAEPESTVITTVAFFLTAAALTPLVISVLNPKVLFGLRSDHQMGEADAEQFLDECLRVVDDCLERQAYVEALEALDRAAAINPSDLRVVLSQKLCYQRLGRLPEAVDRLEIAAEANPESALIRFALACCLAQIGEAKPALNALAWALELGPDLRELAATDPDLEPIRGTPEYAQLAST